MKYIYEKKYIDGFFLLIMLALFIKISIGLNEADDQISFAFLAVLALMTAVAFFSLVFKSKFANFFAQSFVIVVLILPPLIIIYRYVVDLLFYGINRIELLSFPMFSQMVLGVFLFMLARKLSVKT